MVNRSNEDFRTVSTKIRRDPIFIDFDSVCKAEDKTHSAKIKELIEKEIQKKNKPYFNAGNIRVVYSSVLNNYSVKAMLENGDEFVIWGNLSEKFVESLKDEIGSAIQMRNKFVHGLGKGNIAVPCEKIGGGRYE